MEMPGGIVAGALIGMPVTYEVDIPIDSILLVVSPKGNHPFQHIV